ncbi:proteasome assembly chaperone family protein [Candidatus Micrarchaeota archaeon]|nr:proteasome assembly chaperone family protein [Candidatus Micrarchaeota archaeon]
MKETTIIEKKKFKKLKDPLLITGLPGIGLIGQVVGRYLVDELKAEKIANVISPHFPHQVFMTKKGGLRIIKNSFYLYRGKTRDIVILLGDIQAMSSVGQYEVAGAILEYSKGLGVKEILSVGGYSTGKIVGEGARRVFAVSTSETLRNRFKKHGVVFGEARGSIVGAAGLIPVLGKIIDIDGTCLMGETHGSYVDAPAAKQIVQIISKYVGIKINLKKLEKRAAESQKILKKVQEEVKKTMEAHMDDSARNVSYIR